MTINKTILSLPNKVMRLIDKLRLRCSNLRADIWTFFTGRDSEAST